MQNNNKTNQSYTPPFVLRFSLGKEKEYFMENLAMLLSAGMNISDALNTLEQDLQSRTMKRILTDMKADIDSGLELWKALEKSKLFPSYTISLIQIGELSGQLNKNLGLIVKTQDKDLKFRSKISSAMTYPVIILALVVVVGIGISWFILPRLAIVFSQMNLDLPTLTNVVIRLGSFLGKYGFIAIPVGTVALLTAIYFVFLFRKTKYIGHRFLFLFPPIRKIIQQVELARMGFLIGNLINAGLSITDAFKCLKDASNSHIYKHLYSHMECEINNGNSFKDSFSHYHGIDKLIPVSIQQLIITGEQSGTLSKIMIRIGRNFEDKTEDATKNLAIILEPILLVIVWLGVVLLALAVILPLYSLIGGLNQ